MYVCTLVIPHPSRRAFSPVRSRTWPSVCSDEQNVSRINLFLRNGQRDPFTLTTSPNATLYRIEVNMLLNPLAFFRYFRLRTTFDFELHSGNSHAQVFAHGIFDRSDFRFRPELEASSRWHLNISCVFFSRAKKKKKIPLHRSSTVGAWTFVESSVVRYSRARDSTARRVSSPFTFPPWE